jgi:alanyl-tRNA synthetase
MSNPKTWTDRSARKAFLDFFEKRGHKVVSSAPIVLKDDPTLMFTNAGMNQFKEAFLGNKKAPQTRVTDTQKCLRVSGKHNDLEEVGYDTYHHTMFEMLGNWSFGDYFKEEAIAWAWELLTEVYGLDKNRLYASVFEGDATESLARDTDAATTWKKYLPEERILDGNKKDNFWEMGATGPCGPCSEIHIDLRTDADRAKTSGADLVNQDHPQVVEVWNLVFMEFNRLADGSLVKLPQQHVDTGMGFERLCMALQGKTSNYDTDVFQPLLKAIAKHSGYSYGKDEKVDIAMRVIADHVRAVAFAIADGQLPSNTGAGYVIRRILRRAIRYGFSYLNKKEAFIYKLVAVLSEQMGEFFPEIHKQKELVEKVIQEEEQSFLRTLEQGLNRLEQITKQANGKEIEGAKVFELYDTFGFPPDLTALVLREQGFGFNEAEFEKEMTSQKNRARAATQLETGDWTIVKKDDREEFIGYDHTETTVKITRYRKVKAKGKEKYQLVFNLTPFYPEGGGQVGDTGYISNGDTTKYSIEDTQKEHGLIIHICDSLPDHLTRHFTAVVNAEQRKLSSLNHTGTHLLHQALREVLGQHVEQKGSLVSPDYLRFDFSHFAKLSADELNKVEVLVNNRIRANYSLQEFRNIPIGEARAKGAMALFGEKYGDVVRAIQFGDSIELCGGIHVKATGEIGLFTFISEGAVAAGVRRVEALTGEKARLHLQNKQLLLDGLKAELKNPKDVLAGVQSLKEENSQLKKELESFKAQQADAEKKAWETQIKEEQGVKTLFIKTSLAPALVKNALFQLKADEPLLLAVVATNHANKPQIAVAVGEDAAKHKSYHAGQWVKQLAVHIQGGGGGQPQFAMAGGKNVNGLDKALAAAKQLLLT